MTAELEARWRACCNECGWVSGSDYDDEYDAQEQVDLHNAAEHTPKPVLGPKRKLTGYMARYAERIDAAIESGHGYAAGGAVGWEFVGERGPELVSIKDFADPHHAVPALRQVAAWSAAERAAIAEDCHDCTISNLTAGDRIIRPVVTRFCDRHRPEETA